MRIVMSILKLWEVTKETTISKYDNYRFNSKNRSVETFRLKYYYSAEYSDSIEYKKLPLD